MLRTNKKNSRSATQALRLFYMYKKGKTQKKHRKAHVT